MVTAEKECGLLVLLDPRSPSRRGGQMCVFQKRSKPFPFWCTAPLRRRGGPGRRTSWAHPSLHELFSVPCLPAVTELSYRETGTFKLSGPGRLSDDSRAVRAGRYLDMLFGAAPGTVLRSFRRWRNRPPEEEERHMFWTAFLSSDIRTTTAGRFR